MFVSDPSDGRVPKTGKSVRLEPPISSGLMSDVSPLRKERTGGLSFLAVDEILKCKRVRAADHNK